MSKSPVAVSSKEQFAAILKSTRVVVADFYADWCGPCQQAAPIYDALSQSLTKPNLVTFVKINSDTNKDLTDEYRVSALPTFLLFRDAKVIEKVQGADPSGLQGLITKLNAQVGSLGESSASGSGPWRGHDTPKGYADITDQIESKGCELLNADDDFGPVGTLFETSMPSALKEGATQAKDWVESGSDDQLLLYIPFQSSIKLHTIQITSLPQANQNDVSRPETIRLYINRTQNMDFGEADDTDATQEITLKDGDWNAEGTANISLRYVKFTKTTSLVVYVQRGCDGCQKVRIDRLKLVGEAGTKRDMGKLQKASED